MKLSNIAVVFVVIAFVIIAVLTNYITLQRKTLIKQAEYDAKLIDSTKEAIEAFEINTVEWNEDYSANADTKRRSVMGSINTFITTLSNNMNVSGSSNDAILAYIPAIAYTLYDGYYIYSPAEVKVTIRDDNGVLVTYKEELFQGSTPKITGITYDETLEGSILYNVKDDKVADGNYNGKRFTLNPDNAKTTYNHILKPYATYSEKIDGKEIVINYTLDNYISIYGKIKDADGTETYFSKAGYLTNPNNIEIKKLNSIEKIKFNEKDVKPEHLQEQIVYKENVGSNVNSTIETFDYVYDENNQKVYFEGYDAEGNPKFFTLDKDLYRVYLSEKVDPTYKKCVVPQKHDGKYTYLELYQDLQTGNWYKEKGVEALVTASTYGISTADPQDITLDYSAINYCVESYVFTQWFNGIDNLPDELIISDSNDPEKEDSPFTQHKRDVIKNVIEDNLQQAITSYSRNTAGSNFYLPKLLETDWDKILNNVSIITFLQDIPIGLKYYNNYTIATSTLNNEFVDPNEIYLNAKDDPYYHMPYCEHLTKTENLIGYRNTDYVQRNDDTTKQFKSDDIKRFFRHYDEDGKDAQLHDVLIRANQKCYYCLIERSKYNPVDTDKKQTAYYTALARERYIAKKGRLPSQVQPVYYITGKADPQGEIYIYQGSNKLREGSGNVSYVIPKDTTGNYTVKGKNEYLSGVVDYVEVNETENEENAILNQATSCTLIEEDEVNLENAYITNESVEIQIDGYDTTRVYGSYTRNGNPKVETTGQPDNNGIISMSSEDDGEIKVTLHYESNFHTEGTASAKVWANIDKSNKITIITEPQNIWGYVRLKFINGDKEFYSEKIFHIEEELKNEARIKCVIDGTDWYQEDWKVQVIRTDSLTGTISGTPNKIEYYTIKDVQGLNGFANATNSNPYVKTEGREFYLINDIPDVGDMEPISGLEEGFKGLFSGKDKRGTGSPHTINNVNIIEASGNEHYGFFGKLESGSEIKDITLDTIKVDLSSKDYVGGLAGINNGGTISNVVIKSPTIKGNDYVGGFFGENKRRHKWMYNATRRK